MLTASCGSLPRPTEACSTTTKPAAFCGTLAAPHGSPPRSAEASRAILRLAASPGSLPHPADASRVTDKPAAFHGCLPLTNKRAEPRDAGTFQIHRRPAPLLPASSWDRRRPRRLSSQAVFQPPELAGPAPPRGEQGHAPDLLRGASPARRRLPDGRREAQERGSQPGLPAGIAVRGWIDAAP